MIAQVSCLLILVTGSLGAPARVGSGINFGGSGETSITAGASASAILTDPLLIHGRGTALVGTSGKGKLHAGGYALYNDNIIGANGEVHGNAGVLKKSVFEGDAGIAKDGKAVLGGTNKLSVAGEFNGGASGAVNTNEDALSYIQLYGSGSALDDLHKIY